MIFLFYLYFIDDIVSQQTEIAFLKQANYVKSQYERFPLPLPSDTRTTLKLNGTLTLEDNIADILGLQIAFKSYMENAADLFQPLPGLEAFTKQQIFFIASAQVSIHIYIISI